MPQPTATAYDDNDEASTDESHVELDTSPGAAMLLEARGDAQEQQEEEQGEDDEFEKMILFFQDRRNDLSDDDSSANAISFTLESLNESKVYTAEVVEEKMSDDNFCNQIIAEITRRIPEEDRIARSQFKNQLKKWMNSLDNESRLFHFLSKQALQRIALQCQIDLPNANYSIDRLVSMLSSQMKAQRSGTLPSEDEMVDEIKKRVIEAALRKGFMPRLKGKARDYCSIGHKMEKPIACTFMEEVNAKGLVPDLKILSFHEAGLVAKKCSLGQRQY